THILANDNFATPVQNPQLAIGNGKADLRAILVEWSRGQLPHGPVEAAPRDVRVQPGQAHARPTVFPEVESAISIVEAIELNRSLRRALIAPSHERELVSSAHRQGKHNRSQRKRL